MPVFLVLALSSDDGRDVLAAVLFAAVAVGDYVDGLAARLTGQYSRLGTLLDPLIDRLLVVAGVIVVWDFELLPRWALAVLAARELFMLVLTQLGLRAGVDLSVNMMGRLAVWPTMSALGLAMITETWVSEVLLYIGIGMSLAATVLYLQDGWRQLRAQRERPSTSS